MFCGNCGKKVDEKWKNCPYCGASLSEKPKKDNGSANETDEDIELLKALYNNHPARFIICLPIVIYLLFRLFSIETNHLLPEILEFFFEFNICLLIMYLLYGPLNYQKVSKIHKKYKPAVKMICGIIFAYILVVIFVPSDNTNSVDKIATDSNIVETQTDQTIDEYVASCINITPEDLIRNSDNYIDKNIIIEGNFSTVADSIIIGLWDGQGGIEVKYDGKTAYDVSGVEVGNVISGDYGYAAGVYRGEDDFGMPYMDGVIIVLTYQEG